MMTTNLFVIGNVKQLRTDCSFRILLSFFRTSWSVGVLNSAIFISFHNRVEFGTILEGLRNFGGEGVEHPPPPSTPLVVIEVVLVLLWLTGSFRNAVGVVLCVVTMGEGLLNITDVAHLMDIVVVWLIEMFLFCRIVLRTES